ncbi:MAG: hypothetical protein LUC88_04540 [Prevotella sp.]|nr:hypothetical protein [Prevotella sp.]
MADKVGNFTFTPEELSKTFVTYRKELIVMPMLALQEALAHMSVRTGIRYREIVSEMGGKFQLGNYDKTKLGDGDLTIDARIFETFFGNCVEPIDPNAIYQSIWGSNVTKGEGLKNVPIVVQVCAYMMKQLGENLLLNLFTAEHDASNTTDTASLFNGFKTIIQKDIDGTNENGKVYISEDLGNLEYGSESITADNAEDVLKDFFWNSDVKLRRQKLKYFMSDMAYHYYTEAYQNNHGALPYNQAYDKKTLEGASNVELCPLTCVPDDFLLLTPKTNIYALFNQKGQDETFVVERSLNNHFDVDFVATMFFGTQFESVSKEVFRVWIKNGSTSSDDGNN